MPAAWQSTPHGGGGGGHSRLCSCQKGGPRKPKSATCLAPLRNPPGGPDRAWPPASVPPLPRCLFGHQGGFFWAGRKYRLQKFSKHLIFLANIFLQNRRPLDIHGTFQIYSTLLRTGVQQAPPYSWLCPQVWPYLLGRPSGFSRGQGWFTHSKAPRTPRKGTPGSGWLSSFRVARLGHTAWQGNASQL